MSQYQYFAAADDDTAADVLDRPGGPLAAVKAGSSHWDAIDGVDIEPTVNLADLEELVTKVDYDLIVENPRSGDTIASQDDLGLVIAVTDSLRDAMAQLPLGRFASVAGEWSHAEEFDGDVSPGDLTKFVTQFAALAQRAVAADHRLYCWVSL